MKIHRSILIGCLCALGIALPAGAAPSRPNVVIMLTDDQGSLDAHCYGSEDLYTPAMDELATTGVRFTQAYSHAVCCPARSGPSQIVLGQIEHDIGRTVGVKAPQMTIEH